MVRFALGTEVRLVRDGERRHLNNFNSSFHSMTGWAFCLQAYTITPPSSRMLLVSIFVLGRLILSREL